MQLLKCCCAWPATHRLLMLLARQVRENVRVRRGFKLATTGAHWDAPWTAVPLPPKLCAGLRAGMRPTPRPPVSCAGVLSTYLHQSAGPGLGRIASAVALEAADGKPLDGVSARERSWEGGGKGVV